MNQSTATGRTQQTNNECAKSNNNNAFGCRNFCNKLCMHSPLPDRQRSHNDESLLNYSNCLSAVSNTLDLVHTTTAHINRNQVMPHNNHVRLLWHYGYRTIFCLHLYDNQCLRVGLLPRSHTQAEYIANGIRCTNAEH